jgi:hypothetical protein
MRMPFHYGVAHDFDSSASRIAPRCVAPHGGIHDSRRRRGLRGALRVEVWHAAPIEFADSGRASASFERATARFADDGGRRR